MLTSLPAAWAMSLMPCISRSSAARLTAVYITSGLSQAWTLTAPSKVSTRTRGAPETAKVFDSRSVRRAGGLALTVAVAFGAVALRLLLFALDLAGGLAHLARRLAGRARALARRV